MGSWDYKNIGASTEDSNVKHVEKIFEYMGYCSKPDCADGYDECSFDTPKVYYCMSSDEPNISERIRYIKALHQYGIKDLTDLLNALFPGILIYVHAASGNDTSDTWENHDEVYNPEDMTCYGMDSYTDYGGGTNHPNKSWKARFILEPPKIGFVQKLIDFSIKDENAELTASLQELVQKLKNKKIAYPDDGTDNRIINKRYDIIKGDNAKLQLPSDHDNVSNDSDIQYVRIFNHPYSGTEQQIQEEYEAFFAKYQQYKDSFIQETMTVSLPEYLNKLEEEKPKTPLKLFATEAEVSIVGKQFSVAPGLPFYYELMEEIRIRGGFPASYMSQADFYVADPMQYLSGDNKDKSDRALRVQQLGYKLQIITEYQLWKALLDEKNPILTEEEIAERNAQIIRAKEEEKERKKKEAEEAKERRAAERRQRAEEKLRLAEEKKEKEREARRALRIQKQQEEAKRKEEAALERRQQREQERQHKEREKKENEERKELERQQALANADIRYTPGNEPPAIRSKLDRLFGKLDQEYPNRLISGLQKTNRQLGEHVTELYRQLGYPDGTSMLEAYGYTVIKNKGGRSVTVDPDAFIDELKKRYPNGAGSISFKELQKENPDIPWKTLSNKAYNSFGRGLSEHLKATGIIGATGIQTSNTEQEDDLTDST